VKQSRIFSFIISLGLLFICWPSTSIAANLIASEPATSYYTTNGGDPTVTSPEPSSLAIPEETSSFNQSASSSSSTSTDNFYTMVSTTYTWYGTDANRQKLATASYASTYGDEASVSYTLPWPFTFYGQSFGQINADTNGNIWFDSSGPAHSFDLANNGRGPVIAAWNNDLSSYYRGGVFIQHKTDPECVVVEWQTVTYTNDGRRRPNTFEAILFPDGKIRLDYKSFTPSIANKDFGSGISFNSASASTNLTTSIDNAFNLAGQSFLFNQRPIYKIVATGNGCGNITPTGTIPVSSGDNVTFNLSPNPGKYPVNVLVDGVSVGIVNSYTFTNVTANHTISANFITPDGDLNIDGQVTQADADLSMQIVIRIVPVTPLLLAHGDVNPVLTGDGKIDSGDTLAIFQKINGTLNWATYCSPSPTCSNQPVRVTGIQPVYYATMQGAFDAVPSGATIQATTTTMADNLNFQRAAYVTLNGGFGCDYASSTDLTTINGTLTITSGSLTVSGIAIR